MMMTTAGMTTAGMTTGGMMTASMTTAGETTAGEMIVGMMTGMTDTGVRVRVAKLKPKITGKANYLFNPESSLTEMKFQ